MDEIQVKKLVQDGIAEYMNQKQFSVSRIPSHEHTGVDTVKIAPANLLGFPIMDSAPTDDAINGTIRLYLVGGVYRIYCRINNTWRYAILT